MISKVDNVGIAVTNFERSAAWYRLLGFESSEATESAGVFRAGESALYIFQTDSSGAVSTRALDPIHNPPGIDHVSFQVKDVDTCYTTLLQRRVEIVDPPTNQSWGARTLVLRDPDGNVIFFLGPLTS